jgi:nitrate reductase beta subunit
MDVRLQISMVFHLDKCIGCHTARLLARIFGPIEKAPSTWWNNVETKPGTGYPTAWEDQNKYKAGGNRRTGSLN